jgi:hypothetical protein
MLNHNSTHSGSIACDLSIACVVENGERVSIRAVLRYDPADPMAITLAMWVGDDQVVDWTFARQLLADGAHGPVGAGDVRVRPSSHAGRRVLDLSLSSPAGHADLELPAARVATFVRQTYAAVPAATEADLIDWDAELGPLFRPHPA